MIHENSRGVGKFHRLKIQLPNTTNLYILVSHLRGEKSITESKTHVPFACVKKWPIFLFESMTSEKKSRPCKIQKTEKTNKQTNKQTQNAIFRHF